MKDFQLKSNYILVLLLAAGLAFTWMSVSKPISDFGNYYYGAKFASDGSKSAAYQIYDVMGFNSEVEREGETSFFLNHCTVSPQSVVLYRPFAWIGNAHAAKVVFNLFGLAVFVFSLSRLFKKYPLSTDVKVGLIFVAALIPLYYNIIFGQTYLVIAALIIESVLHAEKRPWLSGISLAIAISLKISPVIFLIWFLLEKRFKVVLWTGAAFFLLAIYTLFYAFPLLTTFVDFYLASLPRMMNGFVADPYSSSFQGFVVFLRKSFSYDAILNPEVIYNGGERFVQLLNTIFFIVMSFLLIGAWKTSIDWKKKFLLLILFLNITSGYTSTYSLLLMIPFVSFAANSRLSDSLHSTSLRTGSERTEFARHSFTHWIKVLLYAIVLMFPPRIFDGYSPFLEEYKLWLFIAIFIMEIQPSFGFKRIEKAQLVVGLVFLALIIFKFAQRPEQLPLTYFKPESIQQDYVLSAVYTDSTIEYVSHTPEGFRQFSVPFRGERDYCESCDSYYYINGVKFQRVAKSGDSLIVLSDYHRGPGLFHLYTISERDREQLRAR